MMEAFYPSDFEEELHSIHVSQGRLPGKGRILSLAAAYAQDIAYSYEYLQRYVVRLNARGSGYIENLAGQVDLPSRLDFLEALEFREREIDRCIIDTSARWEWPAGWGAEWGSNVATSLAADDSSREATGKILIYGIRPDKLIVHRDQTKRAIAVQKALLGHHQPVLLNWYTRELLSRLIDVFVRTDQFADFPRMIEIVWSYDLVTPLRQPAGNDNCRSYEIDGILGDYYHPGGGREPLVCVRKRAVDICAAELDLDTSHLINVIIVHELAHWLVHSWSHRGLGEKDEMTAWYQSTGGDVHEAWAQLLTYLVCSGDEGITRTFEKLLSHQPSVYRFWKKVYDACGADVARLMKSLRGMRQGKTAVSLNDWLKMI